MLDLDDSPDYSVNVTTCSLYHVRHINSLLVDEETGLITRTIPQVSVPTPLPVYIGGYGVT